MRAVSFDHFGEPVDVLKVVEINKPEPGPGEVRVRMLMAPINPSDLMVVRGIYGMLPTLPATPGLEGVGIVESSGSGLLGKLLRGKRVAAIGGRTGTWGEFTIIPAKQAIPVPSALPVEQAAAFFVNPATAILMTRRVLRIPAGEWLLQSAAGSVVGRMNIQLGKRFGFRTINIVRRKEQVEEIRSLGGDEVIATDSEDIHDRVMAITSGNGVHFAIDPVGGATGSSMLKCLAKEGKLLVYGSLASEPTSFSPREMLTKGTTISSFWLGRHMSSMSLVSKLGLIREIASLTTDGTLRTPVGEVVPLERVQDAVRQAEQVARGGKVLLKISE